MATEPVLDIVSMEGGTELRPSGAWTTAHSETLESLYRHAEPQVSDKAVLTVDMTRLREIDTLGAWLLEKLSRRAQAAGRVSRIVGMSERYAGLVAEVGQVNRHAPSTKESVNPVVGFLDRIGRAGLSALQDLGVFLQMLGALGIALLRVALHPRSLRLTSLAYQIHRIGWQAIPIVALITFLIGAIIAQQGIFHFRKFGADSYVVDMVGILVLREIGVLIVAIMVAGRSGSAYTAELGSMKMREEIDALSTMGLDPTEVLVLPRVVALVCSLPILTFIGAMSALYGGGLVAWLYGGMSPAIFIARLHEAVSVTHFEVGMIKAPFMALVIGIIACSEGLRVKGSAESLGRQTTTSVVKSIFVVIVLDGLFAVFFASIGM